MVARYVSRHDARIVEQYAAGGGVTRGCPSHPSAPGKRSLAHRTGSAPCLMREGGGHCQTCLVADRQQRSPTRGRGARTCASGGSPPAARFAGRATGSTGAAARTSSAAVAATASSRRSTRWSISSRSMRGAAMKAGQVLSTVEFPGLDADQSAHLQARLASLRDNVPAVGWKQMRKVLSERVGRGPRARPRLDRSRAGRRGEHRPGLPRADHRRARGRDQGPVPRDRRRGRVGHAKPAHARAAPAPADARPRRQAGARRAERADRRGVRLRARGRQPPPPRALLARPSVHRRPGGRHRA